MSNLGPGVMIQMLSGNEDSIKALKSGMRKEIAKLEIVGDDALTFTFTDGSGIVLRDEGQSCCENRYMTTDDKLTDFIGSKLLTADVRDVPGTEGEYGEVHDMQFLVVATTKGVFTVETHNEHNGYYGGFWIVCSETNQ